MPSTRQIDKAAIAAFKGDKAFAAGADARLHGVGVGGNPYRGDPEWTLAWANGWEEADRHYGEEVNGRWPYLRQGAYKSRLLLLELATA